jgi:glutamate decarboxylase
MTGDLTSPSAYASELTTRALPKRRLPDNGLPPRVADALVRDELMLDGNARRNLATFYTTWIEPEVRQLMGECADKNIIDRDEYPQTAEIESRCVHILADLWHAPEGAAAIGCSTTGSSEAAMLGGLALKWRWRKRREAAQKPAHRPNLVCGPVHVCWKQFARYFDVELREIPLRPDAIGMVPEDVPRHCDEHTIGVVPTLGVTLTGAYEPVRTIAEALDVLQERTGLDIPIHVDAASGGFVAPFIQPDLEWDFRVRRVKSINASGHACGLAPLGIGWVIWRDEADLPEELIFHVGLPGGDMPTFGLHCSRSGSGIIAQYYNFIRLGRSGYRAVHQACMETARYLAEEIASMGTFTLVYNGSGGLPAVAYTLSEPVRSGFSLYELSERVRMKGWQIASSRLPPDRSETIVQRILIRHGVSRDTASLLADDLRRALDHLTRPAAAPVHRQTTAK